MDPDEQVIRGSIETWMQATADGNLPRVLELMADDVVFLTPGRPPMRGKEAFAAATRAMAGKSRVDGNVDVQEIRVFGDWAYCWNQLTVTVHPEGGGAPRRMTGPTLSIWKKADKGRWVIFRDANMLAAADRAPA
jgi:uncharacterized protein (TIGR02246 family)